MGSVVHNIDVNHTVDTPDAISTPPSVHMQIWRRTVDKELLFRVKLDDELLVEFEIDIVTLRHCYNLSNSCVLVNLEPLW